MLKIRLQRVGRVHEPSYRLVLTDSKNATKSGKYLENLGNYDSRRGEKAEFKADRITYWMSKGAQATPTVHNLLISKKIITGKKINTLPLKSPVSKVKAGDEAKVEEKAEVKVVVAEAPADLAPEVEETLPVEEAPTEEVI